MITFGGKQEVVHGLKAVRSLLPKSCTTGSVAFLYNSLGQRWLQAEKRATDYSTQLTKEADATQKVRIQGKISKSQTRAERYRRAFFVGKFVSASLQRFKDGALQWVWSSNKQKVQEKLQAQQELDQILRDIVKDPEFEAGLAQFQKDSKPLDLRERFVVEASRRSFLMTEKPQSPVITA